MTYVEFPRRLSMRKADRWLAANNPYRGKGADEYQWATLFWDDQSDKRLAIARRAMFVAVVVLTIVIVVKIALRVFS